MPERERERESASARICVEENGERQTVALERPSKADETAQQPRSYIYATSPPPPLLRKSLPPHLLSTGPSAISSSPSTCSIECWYLAVLVRPRTSTGSPSRAGTMSSSPSGMTAWSGTAMMRVMTAREGGEDSSQHSFLDTGELLVRAARVSVRLQVREKEREQRERR